MGELGASLPAAHLHVVPDDQALFPGKFGRLSHRGYTLGWMDEIYAPSTRSAREMWGMMEDENKIYLLILYHFYAQEKA